VTRSADPLVLPAWKHLRIAQRGRYDDPQEFFRVLYASTSKIGAFTEALADLRPRFDHLRELRSIEGGDARLCAVGELIASVRAKMKLELSGRYLAVIDVVDREPSFVDLAAGSSRGVLEYRLMTERLKTGQFTSRDRVLPRRASRAVYDDGLYGLIMPSAECAYAHTLALFESGYETNRFRARLDVRSVVPAISSRAAIAAAMRTLLGLKGVSPLIAPELLAA
jgi:hypothetical protein